MYNAAYFKLRRDNNEIVCLVNEAVSRVLGLKLVNENKQRIRRAIIAMSSSL